MRIRIRDCFPNNRVCTRLWGHFSRISIPIRGKTLNLHMGCSAFFRMAYKPQMTMEFHKNCIKMKEKSMSKYLEETVVDSTG